MTPYTASQYTNIRLLYFRAAMEANVFPKITTHFEIDKKAGNHCDPRCFDLTRLYQEIQDSLGHPKGSTYGITPSYGTAKKHNVWWHDPVCQTAHP